MNDKICLIISNDGSDARLNKVIRALSVVYDVNLLLATSSFVHECPLCERVYRIPLSYKSPFFVFYSLYYLIKIRLSGVNKIYVVDEQMLLFIPYAGFLFDEVVLDIFDSLYLKFSWFRWLIPQCLLHLSLDKLIVTDSARYGLLPDCSKHKAIVIPNCPEKIYIEQAVLLPRKKISKEIVIGYFGSLTRDRGISLLNDLLEYDDIEVICSGWCYDDYSEKFIAHPKVKYLGVLSQHEVFKVLRAEVDFSLAYYPTFNVNNIYASPNKIWESECLGVPVMINNDVVVSGVVKDRGMGIVIENDWSTKMLHSAIVKYKYNPANNSNCYWDDYIDKLHGVFQG